MILLTFLIHGPACHLPAMLPNARPPAKQSEADGRGRRAARHERAGYAVFRRLSWTWV